MVQEKDAAKKRQQRMKDFLEEERRRMEENTVDRRWYVVEHTPGYNTGGYYDQDIPAENHVVSPYFKTKKEAQEWFDKHEPDKGKTLRIESQRKIRQVHYYWV
jgi:hypothetical protein